MGGIGAGGCGGGGGGAGGEDIGVAQEADVCCCTSPPGDGQIMTCSWQAGSTCPPYTGILDGACGSRAGDGTGGCTSSGGRSGASGAAEVLVLLLTFAAVRTVRRRFA
jgi:hypothetical protein